MPCQRGRPASGGAAARVEGLCQGASGTGRGAAAGAGPAPARFRVVLRRTAGLAKPAGGMGRKTSPGAQVNRRASPDTGAICPVVAHLLHSHPQFFRPARSEQQGSENMRITGLQGLCRGVGDRQAAPNRTRLPCCGSQKPSRPRRPSPRVATRQAAARQLKSQPQGQTR